MRKVILAAALNVISATTAFADRRCDVSLSNDDLVGNYTIQLGPGTLTVLTSNGGQRVHQVPSKTGTATISLYDDVPILFSDDVADGGVLEIMLTHAGSDEIDLAFLDDPVFSTISADELTVVSDSDNAADLPQLIGIGSVSGNGVVVPNSSRLMVFHRGDGGVSATGFHDSTFSPPESGGTMVFHVRISILSI